MATTGTADGTGTSSPVPAFDIWKAFTAIAAILALVLAVVAIGGFRAERGAAPAAAVSLDAARSVDLEEIAADPTDIPVGVGARGPTTVKATLEATEVVAELSDGSTYEYWTFDDQVPGPMIRVREGDDVEITIRNPDGNRHVHSIDLHAVLGPGGGQIHTDTPPGEERSFAFQATRPGLYVYHCANEHIPSHITSGMYGLILVEPAGGLPPVDKEFYVMQADMYTTGVHGQQGHHELDMGKLAAEEPTYVVFNGRPGSLTDDRALLANTGETVRMFVGNGGPNLVSSFHIIGEIFDRLYAEGDVVSAPQRNVQTTLVPSGGATMVEFEVPVPGTFLLVDHSLSRAVDKGALGMLVVEGADRPEIFRSLNPAK